MKDLTLRLLQLENLRTKVLQNRAGLSDNTVLQYFVTFAAPLNDAKE
jgi:hypothetical protein